MDKKQIKILKKDGTVNLSLVLVGGKVINKSFKTMASMWRYLRRFEPVNIVNATIEGDE
jgi:hypothetical protein